MNEIKGKSAKLVKNQKKSVKCVFVAKRKEDKNFKLLRRNIEIG